MSGPDYVDSSLLSLLLRMTPASAIEQWENQAIPWIPRGTGAVSLRRGAREIRSVFTRRGSHCILIEGPFVSLRPALMANHLCELGVALHVALTAKLMWAALGEVIDDAVVKSVAGAQYQLGENIWAHGKRELDRALILLDAAVASGWQSDEDLGILHCDIEPMKEEDDQ